jgi:hypothetical protein
MAFSRLFLNKYTDRWVFHRVDPRYHAFYKLCRHGTYDSERVAFFRRAALWLQVNGVSGNVCEFGTASGESFLNMFFQGSSVPEEKPHYFLFDSFEGLPEIDSRTPHAGWREGQFNFGLAEFVRRMDFYGVPGDRYTAVSGFYEKTLTGELRGRLPLGKLALVHIDCDLFDSTRRALDFVKDNLQAGTLILFDDYYCSRGDPDSGERGAFEAWLSEHKTFCAVPWYDYSIHGKAFIFRPLP